MLPLLCGCYAVHYEHVNSTLAVYNSCIAIHNCYAVQCEQHALSESATDIKLASIRRKLVLPTGRLMDQAA